MNRIGLVVIALALLAGLPAGAYQFTTNEELIDAAGLDDGQTQLDMFTWGSDTHVAFLDDRDDPADTNFEVYYYRRDSDGLVDQVTRLSDGVVSTPKGRPRIAGHQVGANLHLYVVYVAGEFSSSHVYFRRSLDGGGTWDTAVQVDQDFYSANYDPAVAVVPDSPQDAVAVAWHAEESSNTWIVGNRTSNYGTSWESSDVPIHVPAMGDAHDVELDADEAGNLFAAYNLADMGYINRQINVAISDDQGFSYLHQVEFSNIMTGENYAPDVTAWGDGQVAVAWHGNTELGGSYDDILYCTSSDGGTTWENGAEPYSLCSTPAQDESQVRLSNDSGTVLCSFIRDTGSGTWAMFGTFGLDLTANDDCIRLDDDALGSATSPAIQREPDGRITAMWIDARGSESHPYYAVTTTSLLDHFDDLSQWPGAVAVEIDCTKSVDFSGCSAKMGDSSKAEGLLEYAWYEAQNGTVIFWFWDGYTGGMGDPYLGDDWMGGVRYDDGTKAGVVRTLGIVNPGSTYSTQGESGTEDTGVDREEGWHKVEVKSEKDEGKAPAFFIYLDDVLVYQDTSFPYFEELFFQGGSGDAPYNVDELNCYTEDNASAPEAPALSGFGILVLAGAFGLRLRRRNRTR